MAGRRRMWPALAVTLLAASAGGADADAEVYRSVDADGLPVFSDVPLDTAEVAQRPAGVNVYAALLPSSGNEAAGDAQPVAETSAYVSALILAPLAGEAVRANGGAVQLRGQVSPSLRTGHRAVLFVDGAMLAKADANADGSLEFALANVARGSHQARIDVVDANGDTLLQGAPSVFHVLRATVR